VNFFEPMTTDRSLAMADAVVTSDEISAIHSKERRLPSRRFP